MRAKTLGGSVWIDDGLLWIDGPDGMNLMFPQSISIAALRRGVNRAREEGLGIVGAWLDVNVDAGSLAAAGFERGWSPWWMTAALADVQQVHDPRVRLEQYSSDYEIEDSGYPRQLALTRIQPSCAWYAAAHDAATGRFAGRAWSFLDENTAGVFDMEVWPPFRRRGLGAALLAEVCSAARGAGAASVVLNATPEGKKLYSTFGFNQIGEGITWWLHLWPQRRPG